MERIALENQYRCMRVDMLEVLLENNTEDLRRNSVSKVPQSYRDLWSDRLERQRERIQDSIDNNIYNNED